ncbi:MAG TPA: penicillin-binding protein 1C [Xanthobacteraceae bacterium]|nr:penicillin-binding protein 1C [Xanthobacteraceae bacterium]
MRGEGGSRSDPRKRRGLRLAAIAAVLFIVSMPAGAAWWIAALGPAPAGDGLAFSTRVVDRDGRLLRAYATGEGRWRLPARIAEVDPRFFAMLLAYEDKRFRAHHGVDLLALTRAALQLVTNGRVLSGGSTLTMQVARLLEPRSGRNFFAKLRQIVRAIEIERVLGKDEVLALYLDLAPYGGNIEGIRGASLAYFGKEPRRLSLGEAALLVALPQSPESRRPDRWAEAARHARNRVLDRFAALRTVPADEIALAKAEPVPSGRRPMPMFAPHAADRAVAQSVPGSEVRLTIAAGLQKNLEELARERVRALALTLGSAVSLAVLVVDNATGEVVARLGSPDYFDQRRAGQVDMTDALRSPGSTLKPFIYGLGFEDGFIHPETLIDDRPVRYGAYAPQNFDFTFQGTVTVRQALQLSLNVPALAVLDRVGASRLAARIAQGGAPLVLPEGEAPGLAIGLGGVGIKLSDLVMLYTGIARLGTALPLSEHSSMPVKESRRLLEPVAAWYVASALLGTPPPENGAPGRIAFKTGTSYGYRDAWSIGFDGKHTVGVWVGRPDGAPVPGLVGRMAAAPILFDVFARLGTPPVALPRPPQGVLISANAKLPPPLKRFQLGGLANAETKASLRILFPPDGARLELPAIDGRPDPVPLKITGAVAPITVLVNGNPVSPQPPGAPFFQLESAGFARVTVIDASGSSDSVVVRVEEDAAAMPSQSAAPSCTIGPCGRL